ncbi:MAG: hypothetical protein GC168_15525 [Candidatus Hydrogenedens sp.]|nr:hypothetical protein [Candidatus Hydrogenedens sp.]
MLQTLLALAALAAPPTPDYAADVAPILQQHCVECHREGGGAPMEFTSYADARRRARMIARVTQSGRMPPWKAGEGDYHFVGERILSDDELATLKAWAQAGAPGGDLDNAPAPPPPATGWVNGEPDAIVTMEAPFTIPAEGPDIYRNFVVRLPDLPKGTYLKGMDYKPSAMSVAHHVIFTLDTTGNPRRLSDASDVPGYDGMESNIETERLGIWALGSRPHLFPEGVALELEPGTDMVLSTHFHPSGKEETEVATVALYYTQEPPTRRFVGLDVPFSFGLLTNMRIPAGKKHYELTDTYTLHQDVLLSDIFPHAHYLGTKMDAVAAFPDGTTRTLITIKDWDFAWQEHYRYETPVALPAGTRIDFTFHYDNSESNPRNPTSPPKQVTWGPASDDEMACMTLGLIVDTEQQEAALRHDYANWVYATLQNADFGLLKRLIHQGKLERLDWNNDGHVEAGEVVHTVASVIHRMWTTPDESGLRTMLLMEILRRTVWEDIRIYVYIGAGVIAVLLTGATGLTGWLVRRWLRKRKAARQAGAPLNSVSPQGS